MQRSHRIVLALVLISACAKAPGEPPTQAPEATLAVASEPTPAAVDCGPPIRGAETIVAPGSVTLFGEMHGTDAGPQVLGRLACHAATQANVKSVLVGLEISRRDQEALQAAIADADAEAARARLLAATHFQSDWQDGRNTEAIVALVERLRAVRQAGYAVDIVAFDVEDIATDPRDRDAKMGDRLAEAIAARPGTTVLALSGNIHSRTKPGTPWDPEFMPMGVHVAKKVPSVRALDIATAGGTAWMCISPGPPPRFGIAMKPLPEPLLDRVGKPGILVDDVIADSPAERAGLRKGDVILARNGKPTNDVEKLRAAIAEAPANTTMRLEIWRDGAKHKLACKLGDPPSKTSTPPAPSCGEHPLRGEDRGAEPFVELYDEPDPTGHHGRWYVGPVRASPPAGRTASGS